MHITEGKKKIAAICLIVLVWIGLFFIRTPLRTAAASAEPVSTAASDAGKADQPEEKSRFGLVFAITSVLSLAIAVPLAIRSGNKRYGKNP